jgi:low temperature requirement protein LtrA
MSALTPSSPLRHLRVRGEAGSQQVTTVELFFDLVYVFAITQLSHLILADLTAGGVARAVFLLVVVWWAWIYTTWMANWFDPSSPVVRAVLTGVMLASLLMAAALPGALGDDAWLFAATYVALQVGRNVAAVSLLRRGDPLRRVFERLVAWSVASGVLWLAGTTLDGDQRLLLWIPALALDLAAPVAGYWLPGRGRAATTDYDIEGGHFAERCQLFIIIALGESIVVTGATAAGAGLTSTVVLCLIVAFLETAALWWLYFGAAAEYSRAAIGVSDDPGRIARDAYTYLQLPIVAGVIVAAVGDNLVIVGPHQALQGVGLAMVLGGPALFLFGESLFRWRLTGKPSTKRLAVAALLIMLAPLGGQVGVLSLLVIVVALLSMLAVWELREAGAEPSRPSRSATAPGYARSDRRPPGAGQVDNPAKLTL